MKKELCLYADFDFLSAPELVGTLNFDSLRGTLVCGFSYASSWLSAHSSLVLDPDLRQYSGMQFAREGTEIFGCLADALPDRWGRTLLLRREQMKAVEQGRPVRHLTPYDYLTGIDDATRMGGFRFTLHEGGTYLNADTSLRVPPLSSVRALAAAAAGIEKSEATGELPEQKWLHQLLLPGTSLGGTRPKATVREEDGTLCVAKFPSRADDYDVAGWEHWAHIMAVHAGITVASTRLLPTGGSYHTLLSRRFDRTQDGKRRHFASAMTLTGLTDGQGADSGHGYLDIVDAILSYGTDVESNLRELFRRVAFNIVIGNSDDHMRNHGFLLTNKGWTLAPAYDINPTTLRNQGLLINRDTAEASLRLLLESAEDYMLPKSEAHSIIAQVKAAFNIWEREAVVLGLQRREIDEFGERIRWALGQSPE